MSALFFDIDGTILSEITHKIPESALEALHKAQENGHKTFINTGRTICSVPPMIKRISFDGFLCGMLERIDLWRTDCVSSFDSL